MARPKLNEVVELLIGEHAGSACRVLEIDTSGSYPRYLLDTGGGTDWVFRCDFKRLRIHSK